MKKKHNILYTKEHITIPVVETRSAGMPSWCPFRGQCMMLRTIFGAPQKPISLLLEDGTDAEAELKVRDVRPAAKNFCMFCDDGGSLPYHRLLNSCREARKYNTANMTAADMYRLSGGRPGVYDYAAVRYAVYIGHNIDPDEPVILPDYYHVMKERTRWI